MYTSVDLTHFGKDSRGGAAVTIREKGYEALDTFTATKTVVVRL